MNHSSSSTAITHNKSNNLAEDQIKIVTSNKSPDKSPNENFDDSELLSTSKVLVWKSWAATYCSCTRVFLGLLCECGGQPEHGGLP